MSDSKLSSRKKEQRERSFGALLYPESMNGCYQDILIDSHVPCFVSPLHDSDVWTEEDEKKNSEHVAGTAKKAHYHFLMMFDSPKNFETQVKPIFDELGAVGRERISSTRGYARYLCHLDDPQKHQYSPNDVLCLNGADYAPYVYNETEIKAFQNETYAGIEKVISHMRPWNLMSLVNFCIVYRPEWLDTVRFKGHNYFKNLIQGMNKDVRNSDDGNVWIIKDDDVNDPKLYDAHTFQEVRPYWDDDRFNFVANDFDERFEIYLVTLTKEQPALAHALFPNRVDEKGVLLYTERNGSWGDD